MLSSKPRQDLNRKWFDKIVWNDFKRAAARRVEDTTSDIILPAQPYKITVDDIDVVIEASAGFEP